MDGYTYLLLYLFIMGLWKILSASKMITMLLGVEFMMLSVYFLISYVSELWFSNSMLVIIFLTLMVSESVMGLGAYIYVSRNSGKDSLKSITL
uniref:NADH dehydrogenase subunit 4L n=1 Tax=Franciscoloa roseicapillae TaxID=2965268 RepID=UPI0026E1B4B2|nr:NADH dehydrogenase subunit 4L [Franciscoloa roseicapillae]WIM51558.1 NADH dehydrogenase subunit 4L [Franciscoloa roseicapillae]WIM51571.1 NADH dehydrogenase subunit 4L [Franciscoloa roseicapillae]WIM51581.1 NADH dehydrogenase subunit 4L [Franciscoloa roseicapillae]